MSVKFTKKEDYSFTTEKSKSKHDLAKQLEKVPSQLEYVTDQYRVLQEKLNKCECEVHEKGRLFIYN